MYQKYLLHILIIKFILQNAMDLKLRFLSTFTLVLLAIFIAPTKALAVPIQSLNDQTGQTQTFQNDSNVTISSSNNIHSLGWQGLLPLSRGGTGVGSFSAGSVLFSNGTSFAQDNSNFFWDNISKRLGIGTSSPTTTLDVSGNAKVTSLTSSGDAIINSLTVGLGGGSVFSNTAVGYEALISADPTSSGNTAVGFRALRNARYTGSNTAVGYDALGGTSGGGENTAVGVFSLKNNTTGSYNSAFGVTTLTSNTTGSANTALGWESLAFNNGDGNTVIGFRSLKENTTGNYNTVMGREAGWRQANGTSLSSPENSIYIGAFSKGYNDDDDNSIVIGYQTTGAGANKAVIGNSQVTDVYFGSSAGLAKIHAANVATITSGTSAPTSTPTALGQIYIDTNDTKVYISTGTSSSADWKLVN